MKKKILLVNKSFEPGGIQSSLINMANELSEQYEVHLFIYHPAGAMKERLSNRVTVLEPSWRFRCLAMPLGEIVRTKRVKWIAFKLFAAAWSKLVNNRWPIEMAIRHQDRLTGYDLAIAYHQEQRKKAVVSGFARVVDRCTDAKVKAAWLHFDCNTIDLDSEFNNPFYEKMDKVVCVSRSLMDNFAAKYPTLRDKLDYCYNFMLYDAIREKSEQPQAIPFPPNRFVCFSACRLAAEKALTRSIGAMADTFKKHPDVVWYIAGDGVERANVEAAIREYGLDGQIVLIGNQPNPYPYMKQADLVLNVSYHEAAPMTFLESKAVGTPVFATHTSSTAEMLRHGVDAFVCENSADGIRKQFAWVIDHQDAVAAARKSLKTHVASNDESRAKLAAFIDNV